MLQHRSPPNYNAEGGQVFGIYCKKKQTEHGIRPVRQLSSATGTTVYKQIVYRRLGHIGLYARRPVRCVQFTATHCCLRLTWSREHAHCRHRNSGLV
ncbi:transposable element Tcb1 transposase [Trichonephila clavipes]|nr:transposable element Tcb1 transposase [Trichonephila clavipes]